MPKWSKKLMFTFNELPELRTHIQRQGTNKWINLSSSHDWWPLTLTLCITYVHYFYYYSTYYIHYLDKLHTYTTFNTTVLHTLHRQIFFSLVLPAANLFRKTALADDGWFGRLAAPSSPHSSVESPWQHRRSLLTLQDPDDDLVSCTRTRESSILLCWILNMLYKINGIVRRPAGRPRKIWIWCVKENMKSLSIREDFVHHHSNWEWLLRKY